MRGAPSAWAGEPGPEPSDCRSHSAAHPLPPADMALLALFSGQAPAGGAEDGQQPASAGSSAGSPLGASCNTVVVGQAMTAPATQQAAAGLLPTAAPANPVQQLQFQAVLQHQAAIMQNPGTYPAAAQMYQQAMLQTGVLPSQPSGTLTYSGSLATATAQAGGPAPALGKRGKTQEEIEEQTERIKKRRRESAQRRCAPGLQAAADMPRRLGLAGGALSGAAAVLRGPAAAICLVCCCGLHHVVHCRQAAQLGTPMLPPAAAGLLPLCAPGLRPPASPPQNLPQILPPRPSPRPARSRQRKNAYMKSLEMENRALKLENERLR